MEGDATIDTVQTVEAAEAVDLSKRPRIGETIIEGALLIAGALSILTTVGIVYVLASQALLFFFE